MSNKFMLTMCVGLALAGAAVAEPTLKDLGLQKEDQAKIRERIDNDNMKRIYEEKRAQERVKSPAEIATDSIPKNTTIRPMYPPGVKVTVPLK